MKDEQDQKNRKVKGKEKYLVEKRKKRDEE
jgi:hypothetical protein